MNNVKTTPDRQDMLNAIAIAAHGGYGFPDVEMVEYKETTDDGKKKLWNDRYDHIAFINGKPFVWIIAGTGYENTCFPLADLTMKSVREFYKNIPQNKWDWQQSLEKANEELRQYGVMLVVTGDSEEAYFSLEIFYGLDKNHPDVTQFSEHEDYASNYFAEEMSELIDEARQHAKSKAAHRLEVFVVTHVTLHDTDPEANGHTEVKVCNSFDKAKAQMNRWMEGQISDLKARNIGYDILQNEAKGFRMSWDDKGFNQLRIFIHEASVHK